MSDDDDGLFVNFTSSGGMDLDALAGSGSKSRKRKAPLAHKKGGNKHARKSGGAEMTRHHANHDHHGDESLPTKKPKTPATKTRTGPKDPSISEAAPTAPAGKREVVSSLFSFNPAMPEIETKAEPSARPAEEAGLFAEATFGGLGLNERVCRCLAESMSLERPTEVQRRAIPVVLQGKDVMVRSQTGSGKTLAYVLPIVNTLQGFDTQVSRTDGVQCVILAPTRELALQIMAVLQNVLRSSAWIVPGCVTGGEKKKSEKARIRKGINILVATPGRLVDHLRTTACLNLSHARWLVLDEADRLMDLGFERDITIIINALNGHHPNFIDKEKAESGDADEDSGPILAPKLVKDRFMPGKQLVRQNILISATLNARVKTLAKLSLSDPATVAVDEKKKIRPVDPSTSTSESKEDQAKFVTPERLAQAYLCVPTKLRMVTLAAVIRKECVGHHGEAKGKAIVFMSTCDSVDFYYELFQRYTSANNEELDQAGALLGALPVMRLHGNMPQQDRKTSYNDFCNAPAALLLCTDVAARGLHLPHVNWIIQYTVPAELADYVHRVGRTARIGTSGQALLFVTPSEMGYIDMLKTHGIEAEALDSTAMLQSLVDYGRKRHRLGLAEQPARTPEEAATQVQLSFEDLLKGDPALASIAKAAYTSYVRGYATYPRDMKHIMHVKNLHLGHVAKSFAMRDDPTAISKATAKDAAKAKQKEAKLRDRGQNNKTSRGQTTVVGGQRVKSYTSHVPSLLGIDRTALARRPIGPQS